MKLPEKIRIAAYDWDIILWNKSISTAHDSFGRCSPNDLTLEIDETLVPQRMLNTLIHEINHAIYWSYSIAEEDKEERIVTLFANGWTQIFKDNPEVLTFIKEASK